jgi:hypothetical protein
MSSMKTNPKDQFDILLLASKLKVVTQNKEEDPKGVKEWKKAG